MIEIEYIVRDKQGVERLRTADKKAADAYDKALETADRLAQLLRDEKIVPTLPDEDMEELTIYLARNARVIERILKGKESAPAAGAGRTAKSSTGGEPPGAADGADDSPTGADAELQSAEIRPLKAAG